MKKIGIILSCALMLILVACTTINNSSVEDIEIFLKSEGYIEKNWKYLGTVKGEGTSVGSESNPAKGDTRYLVYDDNGTGKFVKIVYNGIDKYDITIGDCTYGKDPFSTKGSLYIDPIRSFDIKTTLTIKATSSMYDRYTYEIL